MQKNYLIVVVVVALFLAGCGQGDKPTPAVSNEPIVTIYPTATTNPLAIVTPTVEAAPLTHGEPARMRFDVGTYGGNYNAGTWTLWAASGQQLRIAGASGVRWRLSTAQGQDAGFNGDGSVTLPISGDYLLTVSGVNQFAIEIR